MSGFRCEPARPAFDGASLPPTTLAGPAEDGPRGENRQTISASAARRRPPLAMIAAAARRRAARTGDAEVDTGHLLHSLLEADPEALAAVAPQPAQAARLMGYLAQRSIGFGRRWQGSAELGEAGTGAVAAVRDDRREGPADAEAQEPEGWAGPVGWSRAAVMALHRARVGAAIRGAANGEPDDLELLAELAADPTSRAAQILSATGINPSTLTLTLACERAAG